MIKEKGKEYINMQMAILMKDNGNMMKKMGKEYISMQMAVLMKENGKTVEEFLYKVSQ